MGRAGERKGKLEAATNPTVRLVKEIIFYQERKYDVQVHCLYMLLISRRQVNS